MPYSKNLAKYPIEFLLIPHLPDSALPYVVVTKTPQAAHALRMKIYGFTEALRANNHPDVHRMDSILIRVQGPLVIVELRDLQYSDVFKGLKELVDGSTPAQTPDVPKQPYKSTMEAMMEKEMAEYHAQQQAKKAQAPAGVDGAREVASEVSSPPKAIAPIDDKK